MLAAGPATRGQVDELSKRVDLLASSLHAPGGVDSFRLLLRLLHAGRRFYPVLFGIQPGDVCIDCGMHAGAFTDVVLSRGGIVYGFEPNPVLFPFLLKKYRDVDGAVCVNKAVDGTAGERVFHFNGDVDSDGGSMVRWRAGKEERDASPGVRVDCVRLAEYLREEILPRHGKIYLLKLDVEGAEFDIIPDLVEGGLHEKIGYIVCETHERFFADRKAKLGKLKQLISEKGITNISLNWG